MSAQTFSQISLLAVGLALATGCAGTRSSFKPSQPPRAVAFQDEDALGGLGRGGMTVASRARPVVSEPVVPVSSGYPEVSLREILAPWERLAGRLERRGESYGTECLRVAGEFLADVRARSESVVVVAEPPAPLLPRLETQPIDNTTDYTLTFRARK